MRVHLLKYAHMKHISTLTINLGRLYKPNVESNSSDCLSYVVGYTSATIIIKYAKSKKRRQVK